MRGQDITCKHITNILHVLPSSCVNLVKSRGFFASAKHIPFKKTFIPRQILCLVNGSQFTIPKNRTVRSNILGPVSIGGTENLTEKSSNTAMGSGVSQRSRFAVCVRSHEICLGSTCLFRQIAHHHIDLRTFAGIYGRFPHHNVIYSQYISLRQ